MQLCLINNSFRYEIEKLIRIFFPFEKIELCETLTDRCIVAKIVDNTAFATLCFNQKVYEAKRSIERSNSY
jgi:hypothetical protein